MSTAHRNLALAPDARPGPGAVGAPHPPGGLWLEQIAPDGRVAQRARCTELPLRVGGGYGHHFVLDGCQTPDTAHLLFSRSPRGTLRVQVVGGPSALLGRSLIGPEPAPLLGSATLQWAGATLRVVDPCRRAAADDDPRAAAAMPWRPPRRPLGLPVLLLALAPGLVALAAWLDEPRPQALLQLGLAQAPAALGVLAWLVAWVFACRAVSGRSAWQRHLAITAGGAFGWACAHLVAPWAAAAAGLAAPPGAAEAAACGWVGLMVALHLGPFDLAARQRRALRGVVAGVAAAAAAVALAPGWLDADAAPRIATLPPLGWHWSTTVPQSQWLADLKAAAPAGARAAAGPQPAR